MLILGTGKMSYEDQFSEDFSFNWTYVNTTSDYFSEFDNQLRKIREVVNYIWGLAAIVGIPGNLLVIIAILRLPPLKTVSNVLIFNLAFADLCFLSLTPLVIVHSVVGHWIFGVSGCKLFLTSSGINQFASAMFLGKRSCGIYLFHLL